MWRKKIQIQQPQRTEPLTNTVGCTSCKAVMNIGYWSGSGSVAQCVLGHKLRLRELDAQGHQIWERVDPPPNPLEPEWSGDNR